ncbi:MAG: sigma-70 family RNA polymerase sigma factor [Polyangiaceae bacterium]|nr:sigma-70 family RNA polymerase sigma factor [Polyangiaceae bacterium]
MEVLVEPAEPAPCAVAPLDTEAVFLKSADFVWRTLHRMGIPPSDVEDVLQEVYVVVHRRLDSFDHDCRLTTWLFGICLKVANRHRRRAYFRHERWGDEAPVLIDEDDPERIAARRQARRLLSQALDALGPEKRAVFVMFELEGQSCAEIAEVMGVPVGTVYSRLHTARRRVAAAGAKLRGLGHE